MSQTSCLKNSDENLASMTPCPVLFQKELNLLAKRSKLKQAQFLSFSPNLFDEGGVKVVSDHDHFAIFIPLNHQSITVVILLACCALIPARGPQVSQKEAEGTKISPDFRVPRASNSIDVHS